MEWQEKLEHVKAQYEEHIGPWNAVTNPSQSAPVLRVIRCIDLHMARGKITPFVRIYQELDGLEAELTSNDLALGAEAIDTVKQIRHAIRYMTDRVFLYARGV